MTGGRILHELLQELDGYILESMDPLAPLVLYGFSLIISDLEQDPSRRHSQNLQQHLADALSAEGDEEKISEEAEALESRFGPQYRALQNYSEEQPLNVSDNADLIQGNTADVTRKEDFRESAILAVSSTTLVIYFVIMASICVFFTKHRMKKGNFRRTF